MASENIQGTVEKQSDNFDGDRLVQQLKSDPLCAIEGAEFYYTYSPSEGGFYMVQESNPVPMSELGFENEKQVAKTLEENAVELVALHQSPFPRAYS